MKNENKEVKVKEVESKEVELVKNSNLSSFMDYLVRNNKQIRADRAEVIAEDTEIIFKRTIEDIELRIKKLSRERENMLDLSPDHALSLKLAEDFNANDFVTKDLKIGVEIRNEEIRLEIAKKRYNYLFGGLI
ncbi:unnamed protein product [marine sediment metagenome]|uniref:Uncharacterized protein n=1 Tax=marine sediment metagenome TaxID=412755 RepID=X0YUY0_9ZZZZ